MRKVSVGILAFVGIVVLLISFASMGQAYFNDYTIGGAEGPTVTAVGAGNADLVKALRGIRGTSAAYAAGYAVLLLAIVFGPYKRGEVWAWWGLFASFALLLAIVLVRIPTVHTMLGVGPAAIQCGLGIVALLLDAGRLRTAKA